VKQDDRRMHGHIDYIQLPARDHARSAPLREVFGWSVDATSGSFEAI
jgi:hypothetical protein